MELLTTNNQSFLYGKLRRVEASVLTNGFVYFLLNIQPLFMIYVLFIYLFIEENILHFLSGHYYLGSGKFIATTQDGTWYKFVNTSN